MLGIIAPLLLAMSHAPQQLEPWFLGLHIFSSSSSISVLISPQANEVPKWTDIGQIVLGGATVVLTGLGFGFVIWQLKHSRQSLSGSTHATVYTQQHAITQVFIECPELRDYFYAGKACPVDDPLRGKVEATADLMADFFEHLVFQRENLPKQLWPAWLRFMEYVYKHSPVIQEHFSAHSEWYDTQFIETIHGPAAHPTTTLPVNEGATATPGSRVIGWLMLVLIGVLPLLVLLFRGNPAVARILPAALSATSGILILGIQVYQRRGEDGALINHLGPIRTVLEGSAPAWGSERAKRANILVDLSWGLAVLLLVIAFLLS